MRASVLIGVFVSCGLGAAAADVVPARYRTGSAPAVAATAVGGGEVFLELTVSRDGGVVGVDALRTTPPYTNLVIDAVRGWQFRPAEEARPARGRVGDRRTLTPLPWRVLVAAVFRAPALHSPTLGEPPRDVGVPSGDAPFPAHTVVPPFPPLARDSGVVIVEVRIEPDGRIGSTTVVSPAPPFDDAARTAARQWTFRPARVRGAAVPTFAYLIFGFPVPIGSTPRSKGRQPFGVPWHRVPVRADGIPVPADWH